MTDFRQNVNDALESYIFEGRPQRRSPFIDPPQPKAITRGEAALHAMRLSSFVSELPEEMTCRELRTLLEEIHGEGMFTGIFNQRG